jgi:hypothetical protein
MGGPYGPWQIKAYHTSATAKILASLIISLTFGSRAYPEPFLTPVIGAANGQQATGIDDNEG